MFLPLPPVRQDTPEVTTASLLETAGMAYLAIPKAFRLGQDSSFDRRSRRPGTPDWFANEDWGHYVREETNEGRREWVLADLKGPGAMVRQWSANPVGTWRYYFDGETTPRLTTTGREIAAGRWLGFTDPYAYVASRGSNLYFPLPYAKSLKVTVDDSDGDPKSMYYVLGHRTYPAGTTVATFTDPDRRSGPQPHVLGWDDEDPNERRGFIGGGETVIAPGASAELFANRRPGLITTVRMWAAPGTWERGSGPLPLSEQNRVSRGLVLEGEFDGERCISVPVPAFFGGPETSVGWSTVASGSMRGIGYRSRLPMPYVYGASLRVRNLNRESVRVFLRAIGRSPVASGSDPPIVSTVPVLHVQFRRHPGGSRPFRDMAVAHLRGRGHYVGTVLQVSNPSTRWWGEGDEKVRVDGEAFPSIWGTGTEDYFGYAWSSPGLFARPYHAQTAAGSPGNYGEIANVRWHVLDPIPYTKSLDFDLEQWHWAKTDSSFATTAFWYAAPGGTPATPLRARDLDAPDLPPLRPEPGAFQGEALEIAERTSGATEIQSGFDDLPDAQLWWRDAAVDGRLALRLPEVPAGRYRVEARVCVARDYGRFALDLDGHRLGVRDFYSRDLGWRKLTLGTVKLTGGRPTLTVCVLAPNRKAEPRRMFALDWIKLVRVR